MKNLKTKILTLCLSIVITLQGCSIISRSQDDQGEILGVQNKISYINTQPKDMVYIPGGSFIFGQVSEDITHAQISSNKTITVGAFYMDDAPVTNSKYRFFINSLLESADSINMNTASDTVKRIITKEFIMDSLYPNEKVWTNLEHHMGDPMMHSYFSSSAFDYYPVVGVSWEAANHYTLFRSEYLNSAREKANLYKLPNFRLPSEAEWEYAAKGGHSLAKYPWGGPSIRDSKGNLLANCKVRSGDYGKFPHPSPVKHFLPNDYGLYDMAGNVAEWCRDTYNPSAITKMWDVNPSYTDENEPLKVTKGGSWKDISFYLETGSKNFEHKDSVRAYIGFRCVMPYFARGIQ